MLICECVENIMIHLYMWNIHICLKNNFEDIDIKAHYLLPNYVKKTTNEIKKGAYLL